MILIVIQFLGLKLILNHNTDYYLGKDKTTLIIGDSHIEADLNDSIISNSVNLAVGGSPVYFNYIKLKKILEHNNQIKTVILGYSPINLRSKGFYEVPKMKSMFVRHYFY
jgi:hypothetical protein